MLTVIQINLSDDTFIIVSGDYKMSLTINYMIEDNRFEDKYRNEKHLIYNFLFYLRI